MTDAKPPPEDRMPDMLDEALEWNRRQHLTINPPVAYKRNGELKVSPWKIARAWVDDQKVMLNLMFLEGEIDTWSVEVERPLQVLYDHFPELFEELNCAAEMARETAREFRF